MKKIVFLLFLFLFSISDLNARYSVSLNSFGNYQLQGRTFYVESGMSDISSDDLEFVEYANYVAEVLTMQGAIEAKGDDKIHADFIVVLQYAISDESFDMSLSTPVYGNTSIASVQTNQTTNANSFGSAYGSAYGSSSGSSSSASGSILGNNNTTSNTTTNSTINYNRGVVGFRQLAGKVSRYMRVVNMYALDNSDPDLKMIWKTEISSSGRLRNLRAILPVMVFASFGYNGTSAIKDFEYEDENNSVLNDFQNFQYMPNNNITINPIFSETNVSSSSGISIFSIKKTPNEVLVVFYKSKSVESIQIPKNLVLCYDDTRLKIVTSDFKLGRKVKKEGDCYFTIAYPPIPNEVKTIDLVEDRKAKDSKYWKGIMLE